MGRREHPSRREFSVFNVDGMSYKRATCNHCGTEMADNSDRLVMHLEECAAYRIQNEVASTVDSSKRQRVTMDNFCDTITLSPKANVDSKLAEMIHGLSLPFSRGSPRFIAFLNALRPHTSRQAIVQLPGIF